MELFRNKGNFTDAFNQSKRTSGSSLTSDDEMRSRNDIDSSRPVNRRSEMDGSEDETNGSTLVKEEIPTVAIKSVRSMFEKMSVDSAHTTEPDRAQRGTGTGRGTGSDTGTGRGTSKHSDASSKQTGDRTSTTSITVKTSTNSNDSVDARDSSTDNLVHSTSAGGSILEEELPPPSMARNLRAKFQQLEQEQGGGSVSVGGGRSGGVQPGSTSVKRTSVTSGSGKENHSKHLASSSSSPQSTMPSSRNDSTVETTAKSSASDHHHQTDPDPVSVRPSGDELPQQGLAKSLLQQWRAKEVAQQSQAPEEHASPSRGRATSRSTFDGRRSQSMSRVETTQREREYKGEPTVRSVMTSREVEIDFDSAGVREDELPAPQTTKNRLALFRELQAESESAAVRHQVAPRKSFKWEVRDFVPASRRGIVVGGDAAMLFSERTSRHTSESDTGVRHGGDEPDHTGGGPSDVGGSSIREDELPPPSLTRNLLQHFKSIEDVTKPLHTPQPGTKVHRGGVTVSTGAANKSVMSPSYGDHSVAESGEFENEPERDPTVIRESDRKDDEELPEQGTTRNLLARFQSLQSK